MKKIPLNAKKEWEIVKNYKGSFSFGGKKVYYKPNPDNIELVVEKIARLLGLTTPYYCTQDVMDIPYYFSIDIGSDGEFVSAYDLSLDKECLPEALEYFQTKYPMYERELSLDLIKIYLMDIFLMNHDRNNTNWGLVIKDGLVKVGIIDNDLSFTVPCVSLSAKRKLPYYMRKYYDEDDSIANDYEDLRYFLDNYGSNYSMLFQDIYELLNPCYIQKVFELVEKENNVQFRRKDLYLELYEEHYNKIGRVFEESNVLFRR